MSNDQPSTSLRNYYVIVIDQTIKKSSTKTIMITLHIILVCLLTGSTFQGLNRDGMIAVACSVTAFSMGSVVLFIVGLLCGRHLYPKHKQSAEPTHAPPPANNVDQSYYLIPIGPNNTMWCCPRLRNCPYVGTENPVLVIILHRKLVKATILFVHLFSFS